MFHATGAHLQELLGGEKPSPAGTKVGDSLPPPLTLMPKDPEPSPLCQFDWIVWHARHVEMPPCWRELMKIPGHDNYQEFAWKVCASFEVLKACNQAKRVDNDHTPLSTPFHLEVPFHTPCQCETWLSGLQTCPITPYHHLHEGAIVLA